MPTLVWLLIGVFVVGAAIGLYALLAPRKPGAAVMAADTVPPLVPLEPLPVTSTDWTNEAGAEFAGLSQSARCDLIFAVGALEDERSHQLLLHALDDPADAVALAAAHALSRNGHADEIRAYAQAHPGVRADTLVHTLALLD
ncbi:MAG: hypothetical protein ACXWNK_02955 [Vulcanimicrobiaceae bacterium]